ncbi:LamG-like jellyroll fold domain-containing protein [Pseudokineococcus sp. 1T1Z-3]|uniref:LamG-like jellyroll fold domain-containing protein n=1 Tax=Pseudokineococcus sp. 1T1Z-3 TaxID=3132745 RepID=UPI003095E00A
MTGGLLASGLLVVSPAAAAELPQPTVHYTFDGAVSGTVTDVSGAGRDGTLVNPGTAERVDGVDDGALDLPGGQPATGAYVRLPRSVMDGVTGDVTVSIRTRWNGTGGQWQWASALGSGTSRYLFTTPSNNNGVVRTALTTTGGSGEAQVTGLASQPLDRWVTLTTVLDAGSDTLRTYLDGALVGEVPTTTTASELLTQAATDAGYIGRSFYGDPLFSGAVDDFQVFAAALAPDQVAELVPGEVPELQDLARTEVDVRTETGRAPDLPPTIEGTWSDGFPRAVPVVWDEVDPSAYAAPGRFTVGGTAAGRAVTASVEVVREGQLTVHLGEDTGEFTGGASGLLYGLYADGVPSDALIEGMGVQTIATKGQDGAQHPGSDALEVLEQLARTTDGDVYVRTTDYYRGFPYQWPGDTPQEKLDGYFEVMEMQLDQIAALDPELLENVVIEPFNEPEGNMFGTGQWSYDGTSWLNDPTDFFAAWDRSHALISEKLPGVRIAGPGTSLLFNQVRGFMEHTVAAGTAPDIVTWHELSDPATVKRSVERFRGWEDEIYPGTPLEGVDLPININEYAFNYHTSVPGQMIQWISGVEESKVQAMIAFWNINGNLSDSAVGANQGNGQWWLYNAYSRMTGRTVAVTPPQPGQSYTLQGVSALDEEQKISRTLLGGADGSSYVSVQDVPADIFGDQVRVTVEEIPWTGQLGDSPEPRHVAEYTADVVDGVVGVDFGGAYLPELTESSAYEVIITPAGVGETTATPQITWEGSYEAEDAEYTGSGYSRNGPEGRPGNVAGFFTSGMYNVGGLRTGSDGELTFTVDVPEDGAYDLQVFSSTLNTFFRVQEQGPTNVFVRVDGAAEQELFLPLGYKWVVWDHADTTVDLTAGEHTITLAAQSLDGTGQTVGDAIIDRIVLQKPDADPSSVYEAEHAQLDGGASTSYVVPEGVVAQDVSGAGSAVLEQGEEAVFWVYAAEGEAHLLEVDVAGDGAATLAVGDDQVAEVDGTSTVPVHLARGVNKVTVAGAGAEPVHLDRLAVTPAPDALPSTAYEAEAGTTAGTAEVVDLSLASGGQAVDGVGGEPGNENTLTLEVEAAEAGRHAVVMRFSNPEQVPGTHYNPNPMVRFADITVNGGEPQREAFVPTFHENNFFERTVLLDLEAGTNTLQVRSEVQPNWDGETYASQTWPGIFLEPELAPILDRLVVSPLAGEPLQEQPEWATDVSLLDVLREDTSGPERRDADSEDFDLLSVAVERVLRHKPDSPVAVLGDPAAPATAFLPDDGAVMAFLQEVYGRRIPTETAAAQRLQSRAQFPVDDLEALLLDHVVVGATLTSEQVLASDGARLTTAGGSTLVVSVDGGTVRLLDTAGDVVAEVEADRLDINRGQVQVAHVVDRVLQVD